MLPCSLRRCSKRGSRSKCTLIRPVMMPPFSSAMQVHQLLRSSHSADSIEQDRLIHELSHALVKWGNGERMRKAIYLEPYKHRRSTRAAAPSQETSQSRWFCLGPMLLASAERDQTHAVVMLNDFWDSEPATGTVCSNGCAVSNRSSVTSSAKRWLVHFGLRICWTSRQLP